jgi:hypothetical protein
MLIDRAFVHPTRSNHVVGALTDGASYLGGT